MTDKSFYRQRVVSTSPHDLSTAVATCWIIEGNEWEKQIYYRRTEGIKNIKRYWIDAGSHSDVCECGREIMTIFYNRA